MTAAASALAPHAGSVDQLLALSATDMAGVDAMIVARMQSPVAVIPALADHLIAATALAHDVPLLTLNTKHFKGIRGLKLA